MARYLGPKAKLCRRFGENIFGNPKFDKILKKKGYRPGQHGPKRAPRKSEYGLHLEAKQKCRFMYEILEKQFKITFDDAKKMHGDAGDNFLKILESRLDSTVFSSLIFPSRAYSRQLISHKHILVNGQIVNIPSFRVKIGDVITFKLTPKQKNTFDENVKKLNSENTKSHLHFDPKTSELKVLSTANVNDIKELVDVRLIVEYYSR